jgi:hypothetical protein
VIATRTADVGRALAAGRTFLLERQDADGLWRDFVTLAGEASDWVTGFVAYCAGSLLMDGAGTDGLTDAVARAAHELIRWQRPNGGWSYNSAVPTDCDSTAWVLLALSDQPEWRPSSTIRARRYLISHRDEMSGGFVTYSTADAIHRYIAVPETLTGGWRLAQPCVTAAAVRALLVAGGPEASEAAISACAYLRAAQDRDGLWRSYWWSGPGYPTYQALSALAAARALDIDIQQAAVEAVEQQAYTAEGFELAQTLLAAALLGSTTATATATDRLLGAQRDDGSWASAPFLRIPPPMIGDVSKVSSWGVDELGTAVVITDIGRLFSTAAALAALANRTGRHGLTI